MINNSKQSARKRIIMITGVQRSGTTALFDALATAQGVSSRNESSYNDIYDDYYLRPESEIRDVLTQLPRIVLLKPVRESERRSPKEISEEYAEYDLRIVWLYRDPVNVFDSYVRRGWRRQEWSEAWLFAHEWQIRNEAAVADAESIRERLLVVQYEDLTADPSLLPELGRMLGLDVRTGFGVDTSLGRSRQPQEIRHLIDEETASVLNRLLPLRTLRPAQGHDPRIVVSPQKKRRGQECEDPAVAINSMSQAALYPRWLAAGPLRRDFPQTKQVLAVGYEECRAALFHSRAASPIPSFDPTTNGACRPVALAEFFVARRASILCRQRRIVDRWVADLPINEPFDLFARLAQLAIDCTASWLDAPSSIAAALRREAHALFAASGEPAVSPAWDEVRDVLSMRGLVADLIAAGLLTREEILGFLCNTGMRILALPTIVSNALCIITDRPEELKLAKTDPVKIPGLFTEAMRLMPMWFSLRRTVLETIRIDGVNISAGAMIDVIVAAANRDPKTFDTPYDLRHDRLGPPPLLMESHPAAFCCLQNDPPWGGRELVFDLGFLVFERLLSGPIAGQSVGEGVILLPMPSGNVLQMPQNRMMTREQISRR